MKNRTIAAVILLAIVVAVLAGLFASRHPDGLEKVSSDLKIDRRVASNPGVIANYHLPAVPFPPLSAAIAGIFGVILIFFVFRSISNVRHIADLLKKLLNLR